MAFANKPVTEESIEVSPLHLSSTMIGSSANTSGEDNSYEIDSVTLDQTLDNDTTHTTLKKRRKTKWYLRLLILISAVLVGFLISGVVYYAARLGEVENFESEFQELAHQVIQSVEANMARKLVALDGLSIAFTSHTLERKAQWPMVTLPDFDLKVENALVIAGSRSLIFAPLVKNETRATWYSFISNTADWTGLTQEEYQAFQTQSYSLDNDKVGGSSHDKDMRVWQHFPVSAPMVSFDLLSSISASFPLHELLETQRVVTGRVFDVRKANTDDAFVSYLSSLSQPKTDHELKRLVSNLFYPLFDDFGNNKTLVGVLSLEIFWQDFFSGLVPLGSGDEIICVLQNKCGQVYTFQVHDDKVTFLGKGDLHDSQYSHIGESYSFESLQDLESINGELDKDYCMYSVDLFPSERLEQAYVTFRPALYTASCALVFVIIFVVSIAYERRVEQVSESAFEYHAIIANLFPAVVRERLFRKSRKQKSHRRKSIHKAGNTQARKTRRRSPRTSLLQMQDNGNPATNNRVLEADDLTTMSKPIADHFPDSTVLFADIAGFTAWSSKREPEQVFVLLQGLFNTFDKIAKKRGVFKVETIGDCYMAVTGVPTPQDDHALRMTKFARECLNRVKPLLSSLEEKLGEGTGDLDMRFGLHSGPVTAGVLQGEKSRFQLFGDTVNTASRMESNGQRGSIHVSKSTADLLREAGKVHWLEKRQDPIHAKGKGILETYWIVRSRRTLGERNKGRLENTGDNSDSEGFSDSERVSEQLTSSLTSFSQTSDLNESLCLSLRADDLALYELPTYAMEEGYATLIDWHVEVLGDYLNQILLHRARLGMPATRVDALGSAIFGGSCVFDEVSETVSLPSLNDKGPPRRIEPDSMILPHSVVAQLRDFISTIVESYRTNPFHNFVRATHVAMFTHKFVQQIVRRGSSLGGDCAIIIASDPLLQFSLIFSALIHDADHAGVSNRRLAKENPELARIYKERMIAEQHSVDLAWELLMDSCYGNLQQCIFSTMSELKRFRQLVVNLVLATDLSDKEMGGIRILRWNEAFKSPVDIIPGRKRRRLKISISIELLLQVGDVSHTMQAWSVYIQWNRKMFQEMYEAYRSGRSDTDPAKAWFAREIFFFDNHCIPMLEKLKQTGMVSCDSLLDNVRSNRQEWMLRGKKEVERMISEFAMANKKDDSFTAITHNSNNNSYRFRLKGEEEPFGPGRLT